ncbi:hypothetical protein SEA_ARGAN_39 [Arthrobacter phage Argan]|nr:hypothetical protein SEA_GANTCHERGOBLIN_39 [Arthrobacter phage GantcherGoblin]WNT45423.1 hypothetical protein SEA_ARGAN_39 [Arthrobacter phage Argan]
MIPFKDMISNASKFAVDNSPTILTGLAVAGTLTTAYLAVKATPAAMRDIQHAESEQTEPLTKPEVVKLCWKHYVPAAATGLVTVTCIVGANTISSRRQAALIGMYTFTEKAFRDFQEKAEEHMGETKVQKVKDDVAKDYMDSNPVSQANVILTGHGQDLFLDELSGRYFLSTMEAIRKAENDIGRQCINEQYASQNDFYHALGIPSNGYGEEFGWNNDCPLEISFSTQFSDDGRPCGVLNYRIKPNQGFYKFG